MLTDPTELMVKVPFIVGVVPKFTAPAIVTLLNPIVPVTVPLPAKATVPAPNVNVLLPFAKVPPEAMFKVPPAVIMSEPLFVKVVAVSAPLAPKVSDFVLLMVTVEGA